MKIPSNNSNSTGVVFQITGTLSHTPSGRNIPVSEGVATPLQAVHRLLIEANKPPTNYEMADSVPTPQLEGKEIFANPRGLPYSGLMLARLCQLVLLCLSLRLVIVRWESWVFSCTRKPINGLFYEKYNLCLMKSIIL